MLRRLGPRVFLLLSMVSCTAASVPDRGGELGVFSDIDSGTQPVAAADGGRDVLVPGLVNKAQDAELRARIATPAGLTLEILTVGCAGDCADVVVEAHGGNPPYHVKWEDGSTTAARHVCPEMHTTLEVDVTDTAITDAEFGYTPHTATATVAAEVLDCPVQAPAADGGAAAEGVCLLEYNSSNVDGDPCCYREGGANKCDRTIQCRVAAGANCCLIYASAGGECCLYSYELPDPPPTRCRELTDH